MKQHRFAAGLLLLLACYDEHGSRLPAPNVPACGLSRFQGGQHAQSQTPFGGPEGLVHGRPDVRAEHQVGLHGKVLPHDISGGLDTHVAGVGGHVTGGVDHGHLPHGPAFIGQHQLGQGVLGGGARGHEAQTVGPVVHQNE